MSYLGERVHPITDIEILSCSSTVCMNYAYIVGSEQLYKLFCWNHGVSSDRAEKRVHFMIDVTSLFFTVPPSMGSYGLDLYGRMLFLSLNLPMFAGLRIGSNHLLLVTFKACVIHILYLALISSA